MIHISRSKRATEESTAETGRETDLRWSMSNSRCLLCSSKSLLCFQTPPACVSTSAQSLQLLSLRGLAAEIAIQQNLLSTTDRVAVCRDTETRDSVFIGRLRGLMLFEKLSGGREKGSLFRKELKTRKQGYRPQSTSQQHIY